MSSNRMWFILLNRMLLVAAALSLAAICMAACASDPKSPARTARTATELYPLKAAPTPDKIALALHAGGLSSAQAEALRGLAARRAENEGGSVDLSVPHGAVDEAVAAHVQDSARALLLVDGVPPEAIHMTAYDNADPKAPLLVSYSYVKPQVPACGKAWDDLTHTEDNRVQSNFGCAVSANMMAQIARPADIVHPRAEDAADADRRQTVLTLYKAGKPTAAEDEPNKSGLVSKAVP